jgi:hypothetical protein
MIKGTYDQSTCNVLHKSLVPVNIPVLNGVKQGCILSPLLFDVTLDYVMSKVLKNSSGIRWGLSDLNYADDMCLIAHFT